MVRAPSTVFDHGWPRVRDWPLWAESTPLITLLLAVSCGYLGWIAFFALHFHFHPTNLVLFAALVAAGASRDRRRGGREAWARGLIAAGIMVAPGANPGAHVLLLAPDHTGIGVPVLIALLVVDRLRPRRLLPVLAAGLLVCLLLTWAQLDDLVAAFSCALPLALACATPLAAAITASAMGRPRVR